MTFPVLKTGDTVQFSMLGSHIIPPIMAPVPLIGKGATYLENFMPVCLFGDELPPFLRVPLPYTDASFTIPGMGKIVLVLPPTHMAKTTTENFQPVLLAGPPFQAQFVVNAPAQMPAPPAPPVPDPVPVKNLMVSYITTTVTLFDM